MITLCLSQKEREIRKKDCISRQPIPVMKNLFQGFPSTFHCRCVLKMVGFCFFHVDRPFNFDRRRGILHGWHFLLQFVGSAVCTFPEFMHRHLHLKNTHQVKINHTKSQPTNCQKFTTESNLPVFSSSHLNLQAALPLSPPIVFLHSQHTPTGTSKTH